MVWETLKEVTIKLKLQDRKKQAMLRAGEESFPGRGPRENKALEVEDSLACSGDRKKPASLVYMEWGTERDEMRLEVCMKQVMQACKEY